MDKAQGNSSTLKNLMKLDLFLRQLAFALHIYRLLPIRRNADVMVTLALLEIQSLS